MIIRLPVLILALACAFAGPAPALEQVLALEPEATAITFLLDATGHKVNGRLFLESGEIRFDLESGTADGEVTIDARRADTGNRRRDKTMHSKVLESERYPLFSFRPTSIEGKMEATEASTLTLTGMLALHGSEHPFSIPVRVEQDADQVYATATFLVPYAEWGLHRPSVLFFKVAPVVEVRIEAKGSLATASGLERALD